MNLRKLTAFLLTLAILLCSLAACKEEKDTSSNTSTSTEVSGDNASSENGASTDESSTSADTSNTEDEQLIYTYDAALDYIENRKFEAAYTVLYSLKNENEQAAELLGKFKAVYTKHTTTTNGETIYADEYTYDENGNMLKYASLFQGAYNGLIECTYGENGNLLKRVMYDGRDIQEFTYDENNKLIKFSFNVSNIQNDTWEYTYDEYGNILKEFRTNNMDGSTFAKDYTYDENGKLIKTETTDGEILTKEYNEKGLLIKETEIDSEGRTAINEYFYDDNGVLNKKVYHPANENMPTIEYTYDVNGNVIKETDIDSDGNTGSSYEYSYDENGNMIKRVLKHSDGTISRIEENEYDKNGNKLKYVNTHPESDTSPRSVMIHEYTYDKNGNLIKSSDSSTFYNMEGEVSKISEGSTDEYSGYIYFYFPNGLPKELEKGFIVSPLF